MTRIILTASLIVLLSVLIGCSGADSGRAQLLPEQAKVAVEAAKVAEAGETDIVEEVSVNRQGYRESLKLLIEYYNKTGNNMKLQWATRELDALNRMPQYNYIIEAGIAGPNLRARTSIPEADVLYDEAVGLEKEARKFIVITNDNLLRLALDKYNQLIRKHPSSDKIDDAAYKAAEIYKHFNDYTIAVLYYQRTYQWDPETIYPARYRAAYILDQKLHRRAEAVQLYRQFVKVAKKKNKFKRQIEFAEERIEELTRIDERGE
ncbi:MAG: tetratricopeptide repeat protein [Planctomycetota bacterium]|jgi:tetratricopeptide (TPR) repeat protein